MAIRQALAIPQKRACTLGIQARDGFEQGGFSASRRTYDGHEMPPRHADRDVIDKVDLVAVFFDGKTNFL